MIISSPTTFSLCTWSFWLNIFNFPPPRLNWPKQWLWRSLVPCWSGGNSWDSITHCWTRPQTCYTGKFFCLHRQVLFFSMWAFILENLLFIVHLAGLLHNSAFFKKKIEVIGVIWVNKIILVSGIQFNNISSVYCIVRLPPQVKKSSSALYKCW